MTHLTEFTARIVAATLLSVMTLWGCTQKPPAAICVPIEGGNEVLGLGRVIIVGVDGATLEGSEAVLGLVCAARELGKPVILAIDWPPSRQSELSAMQTQAQKSRKLEQAPADERASLASGAFVKSVLELNRRDGALVSAAAIGQGDSAAAVGETSANLASAVQKLAETALEAQVIVLTTKVQASRVAFGLSGETFLPMAARLPEARSLMLAHAGGQALACDAGVCQVKDFPPDLTTAPILPRVRLTPIQDVPPVGAPLVYDGVIEIGRISAPGANR